MRLSPDPEISAHDVEQGKQRLVLDSAFASLAGSLYGGVVLVGFALAIGASPFQIGLLAALPLMAQAAQLPAIALVERIRKRRKIAVLSATAARVFIVALVPIPWLVAPEARFAYLIAAEVAICVLGSICGCALNSWLHDFLPRHGLGVFLSRRLFWGTALTSAGALSAGLVVDYWPFGERLHAYSLVFAAGALAGFASSWFLARVPEPRMTTAGPAAGVWEKIRAPLADPNFRSLIVFMAGWNLASNIAAPFIAVYLMQQLGYSLGTVTTLSVASQLANAFTLHAWGRVSDRLSNKGILSVAVPVYFACLFAFIFVTMPESTLIMLPLLFLLHMIMGAAAGGIVLATGNVSLRLAPHGQGTSYLAAISLTASVAGGLAPILGGAIAQGVEAAKLSLVLRWASPSGRSEFAFLEFLHWHFLFALAAAGGLYVMHALSRVNEGHEIPQREVVQEFAIEALRTVNQLSSIGGLVGGVISFGRLIERRIARRE
jgi:MFS family permease